MTSEFEYGKPWMFKVVTAEDLATETRGSDVVREVR